MDVKKIMEDIFQPAGREDIAQRKDVLIKNTEAISKEVIAYVKKKHPNIQVHVNRHPAGENESTYFIYLRKDEISRLVVHITTEFIELLFQRNKKGEIDSPSWHLPITEKDKKDVLRSIDEFVMGLREDIFQPATEKEVAKRREELMKSPHVKYWDDLRNIIERRYPKMYINSDIVEEGECFIEATVNRVDIHTGDMAITPFAIWIYPTELVMVLKDVYTSLEKVVGSFTIHTSPERLIATVIDPIYREVPEWQLNRFGKKAKRIAEDIFKPASEKDLAFRAYEKWKQGRPFPFLQHIDPQEVLSKGYGAVKGVIYDPQERSEIWVKHGVEIIINYDEDLVADDYFTIDKKLTQEYNESGLTSEEWIKSIPGAHLQYSGYSGNEDPHYFWGGQFSYTVFNYDHKDFVILNDKVMEGDFEGFWSTLTAGEPDTEIAHIMGYENGDYEQLESDIKRWYESEGEIVKDEPDPNTDPMQLRFPFMDEPVR